MIVFRGRRHGAKAMASIHETAEGLHSAGVMDKRTMRKLNEACLTPVHSLSGEEIRALREGESASQAVFARYLGVTTGLVSQWERGEKRPGARPSSCWPDRQERPGRGRLMGASSKDNVHHAVPKVLREALAQGKL